MFIVLTVMLSDCKYRSITTPMVLCVYSADLAGDCVVWVLYVPYILQ